MEMEDGVLIITDSISVSARIVVWALQHFSIPLKDLRIITQASLLEGSLYFKSSSLSTVISISEKPGFHNQLWLLELVKVLKPGGFVFLQEPSMFINGNKDFAVGESRACLERNLLFAGFYPVEGFECLDHTGEIGCSNQEFELIAIKARKTCNVESSALQKKKILRVENPTVALINTLQPHIEDVDDFIDEDTLLAVEDLSRTELPLDNAYLLRERIRERNRLYQRRRRARMTEEQKNREKERRRQYMQNRRIQPINYEVPLPLSASYKRTEEGGLNQQCVQRLQESIVEMEHDQGMGAGETS